MHISETDTWPLPIFRLDRTLKILHSSQQARKLFAETDSFVDLLDEGSRTKATAYIRPDSEETKLELNLLSSGKLLLADVYAKWEQSQSVTLVVVPKDDSYQQVSEKFVALRHRLNETNYDLLLEKLKVEELLQRVRELSAPLIKLDRRRILIPLFGDLDEEKMMAVNDRILYGLHDNGPEIAIIDFTAVAQIDDAGVKLLDSLFQAFTIIGISVIVTGLHPRHAQRLHELQARLGTRFVSSLQEVLG